MVLKKNKSFKDFVVPLPTPYSQLEFYHRKPGWEIENHQHMFFQISIVIDGIFYLKYSKGKHKMHKGDLSIIPPGTQHYYYTEKGCYQIGIQFNPGQNHIPIKLLMINNINEILISNCSDNLDNINFILNKSQNPSLLTKLKVINNINNIILSTIDITLSEKNQQFRTKLLNILNNNLDKSLSLKEIAKKMAISQSQLEKLSKKEFGCGVIGLFNNLKYSKACKLLANNNISIKNIAENIGFNYQSYFTRFFKNKSGITPTKFRDKHGN